MSVSKIGTISITDLGRDGARVSFPKDAALIAAFRARFPKARWSPTTRSWGIPGPLAGKRATKWAGEVEAARIEAEKAAETVRRDAEFEGRLHEVDPAAALAARSSEIKSTRVLITGASVSYDFDYLPAAISVARSLPGAKFNTYSKIWSWRIDSVGQVDPLIEGLNRIYDLVVAARKADEAERARLAQQRAEERAAQDARMAEVRAHRYLELASRAPSVGSTLRLRGQAVTVESLGRVWRATEDTSSVSDLIGCEGQPVRYIYWRAATEAEAAALEIREAAAKARTEKLAAQRAAVATVQAATDAPQLGREPEGEIIWRNDRSAATGFRQHITLTADGWLWHVTYDGSDGAAWGDYNLGYNTYGARMPATEELVSAIRGTDQK